MRMIFDILDILELLLLFTFDLSKALLLVFLIICLIVRIATTIF